MMASLLYGAGLHLMECVRLQVKDVEFYRHEIIVREGMMWRRPDRQAATLPSYQYHTSQHS